MNASSSQRSAEALLLLAVLVVTLCGLLLVYGGKTATTPYPASAVNINTAAAGTFIDTLGIDAAAAQALVQERAARGGFRSVNALRHAHALRGFAVPPADPRLVARSQGEVARAFFGGLAGFVLAFALAHILVRRFTPRADPFLLPLTALLSGLGLMMTYSVKDPWRDTLVFGGQVRGVVFWGLLALLVPLTPLFARLNLRRYEYVYALAGVGLMLLLLVAGHGPGGVRIQVLSFEPVEVIKVLLALFAASFLAARRGMGSGETALTPQPPLPQAGEGEHERLTPNPRPRAGEGGILMPGEGTPGQARSARVRAVSDTKAPLLRPADFAPMALLYGFALLLFAVVRDLGPAVLLLGLLIALLYMTTQRVLYPIVGAALLAVSAIVGYKLHFGFFATRVVMWLHPFANNDRHGEQLGQALWGFATGGLTGSGLGLGDAGVMPRAGSDLVFASVGEQLGLVGTLATLAVYTLLLARGMHIARRAVTEFDRMLASGLTVLLTLQAMIITGGVTGLVPLTGITLPFVSYGTSSLVANFFCVGLLLQLSDKRLPPEAADLAPPGWTRAARRVTLAAAIYLLLGVGVARLFYVQGVAADTLAVRAVRTPDADGVVRPHVNPRLLLFAQGIPRGRILDRNGLVLAQDARCGDADGVPFLCPDGRARSYAGGPSCGHLLLAAEGARTDANPLGQNARLRGYASLAGLLPAYRARFRPFAHAPQGRDVTLTIDVKLQKASLAALTKYAALARDRRTGLPKHKGAAVLLDVATGDTLAIVSLPAFDPARLTAPQWNRLHTAEDKDNPLLNRALAGLYPPGSVFKMVTATAALRQGLDGVVVTCPHTEHNVTWRFEGRPYARRQITDEEGFVPHGRADMAKALRVSCNVYFAHMALDLGPNNLLQSAQEGFGLAHMPSVAKTGEDLPDCGYGQGAILTTPLEMARVAQAVANSGVELPVRFAEGGAGVGHRALALSPSQAARLQTMLGAVTQRGGTAQGVFDNLPVRVAGKTGSAQNNQGDGETHSWFAGFAPAQNPTFAFACVVENGGFGRSAAAPVCRDMLRAAL